VGEGDTPRDISRLIVPEAARQLGISPEAVRNRLSRGTLKSVKEGGTVYVLLEADRLRHIPTDRPDDIPQPLVEEMRGRIESLERQLEQANERDRENRRIIAALTSRIPAIEAPSDEPGSPDAVDKQQGRGQPRSDAPGPQEGVRRPWWRRIIGG
jgi:predicted DNA-binding transcriptional regulator